MRDDTTVPARRLMLALDAGYCAAADFSLAIELASLIGAELRGVFVEDSDLLRLAQLPFAREVGSSSARDRPIVRAAVESALRRRVQRVAAALEHAGRRSNVSVSHTMARGKIVQQALELGTPGDVVLLRPPMPMSTLTRVRAMPHPSKPVMVWHEDGPTADLACEIAVHLARRLGAELLIAFSARPGETPSDARARLARHVARAPGPVRLHAIAQTSVGALLDAARAMRPAQLVLATQPGMDAASLIERLLRELAVDLVLVR